MASSLVRRAVPSLTRAANGQAPILAGRATPSTPLPPRHDRLQGTGVRYMSVLLASSSTVSLYLYNAGASAREPGQATVRPMSSAALTDELTLFQYQICPFCNKVKAFMSFFGLKHRSLEVNPTSKAELKLIDKEVPMPVDPSTDKPYSKVPSLLIGPDGGDREWMVDSSQIVAGLVERMRADPKHAKALERFYTEKDIAWEKWCDEKLGVLLFPNLVSTLTQSFQAFSYVWSVPTFSLGDKVMNHAGGSLAMWLFAGPKIKKKYGITDERKALLDGMAHVTASLGDGHYLLGGDLPSYADVCVYGVLRALEGLRVHDEVMATDGKLAAWYKRVGDAVACGASQ